MQFARQTQKETTSHHQSVHSTPARTYGLLFGIQQKQQFLTREVQKTNSGGATASSPSPSWDSSVWDPGICEEQGSSSLEEGILQTTYCPVLL